MSGWGRRQSGKHSAAIRIGLAMVGFCLAVAAAGASAASTPGMSSSGPEASFLDYQQCYGLDSWRFTKAAEQGLDTNSIRDEAQDLMANAVTAGASEGRSSTSAIAALRSFAAARAVVYARETAGGAVSARLTADESFCRRRGLVSLSAAGH